MKNCVTDQGILINAADRDIDDEYGNCSLFFFNDVNGDGEDGNGDDDDEEDGDDDCLQAGVAPGASHGSQQQQQVPSSHLVSLFPNIIPIIPNSIPIIP